MSSARRTRCFPGRFGRLQRDFSGGFSLPQGSFSARVCGFSGRFGLPQRRFYIGFCLLLGGFSAGFGAFSGRAGLQLRKFACAARLLRAGRTCRRRCRGMGFEVRFGMYFATF
jgi:hypothetical protein